MENSKDQKVKNHPFYKKKPKSYQKHPVLPPILAKTSPFIPFHPLPIHPSVPLKPGQSPNSCFPARSLVAIELGLW